MDSAAVIRFDTDMDAAGRARMDPAYVFFTARDLIVEYRAIIRALPHWGGPRFRPPGTVDGARLAARFAALLPHAQPPGQSEVRAGLGALRPAELFALSIRLHRLRRALDEPGLLGPADGPPLFAVPPVWCRRWEMLVRGRLLPTAVRTVELDAVDRVERGPAGG